jgi:hypothetical protein
MATSIRASRLREGIHAPSNSDFCRPPIPPHGQTVTINFRDVERGIRPAVKSSAVTPAGACNPKVIQTKVVTLHIPHSTGQPRKYGSAQHRANQPRHLYVRLTDGWGKSRAIRRRMFTDFPYPSERNITSLIKSALKTVRIPGLATPSPTLAPMPSTSETWHPSCVSSVPKRPTRSRGATWN